MNTQSNRYSRRIFVTAALGLMLAAPVTQAGEEDAKASPAHACWA
jgi:hypothetical protein